jgi:ribosome-binding protein aMBF1 (putative translation factor)
MGAYGIIWNDELDIEAETIYADGVTVKTETNSINIELANAIYTARANAGLSQKQVSELSGIDQSDFSKIERGIANPTISTLERISKAMGGKLSINIENKY